MLEKNLLEIIYNFSKTAIFDEYEIYVFNQYMAIKDKQQTVYIENFLRILSLQYKGLHWTLWQFMKSFRTISLFNMLLYVKIYNQPIIFEAGFGGRWWGHL